MRKVQAGDTLARAAFGFASFGLTSAAAVTGALAQEQLADNNAGKHVETVTVTARKAGVDALPKQILDTAQSINVVPQEVIKQQGITNLQDALKNVPGITLNAGEGGTHGDQVNIRGFDAHDDFFLDGLRDTGMYTRDSFDYDSVEVYKGPASTLFGRGSTGGVINQITKTPELFPIEDALITGGTNSEARLTTDSNLVLGDDTALRIAAMGQISSYEGRPFAKNRRWGIAPSFATGIGTDTVFTLKFLHQQEDNTPDYGIPFLFGKPAPVAHNTYYGLPTDDRSKTNVNVVTSRVEHKFNDMFSISDSARYGSYWFDSRQTAATYGTANCYNAPAPYAGAPVCSGAPGENAVTATNPLYPAFGTPLDQIFIERDRPSSTGAITTMMNNLDFTSKFASGGLQHTLVAGVELDSEFASLRRYTNQNTTLALQPILNPDPFQAVAHQTTIRQTPVTKTHTAAGYVVDTIDIGEHWNVVGAIRFDHFGAHFDQPLGTPSHFTHLDNVFSQRVAVVYKPGENSSIYASYGTSFNPSAENLSLAANNQALPPEKDHTFEVGAKTQMLDGLLSLTFAAFDTTMENARITDPLFPALQTLAGTEKVRGVEFGAQGHITDNWEIVAGYTLLDPHAVGLIAAGVTGPIPNTAKNQGNIWTTYDFDNGFKIGGGVNFVGTRFSGTDTLVDPGTVVVAKLPAYVTFDAMAGYQFTDDFALQLNAYNLFDKFYYANSYFTRPNENHAVPGAGRTVMLTAAVSL